MAQLEFHLLRRHRRREGAQGSRNRHLHQPPPALHHALHRCLLLVGKQAHVGPLQIIPLSRRLRAACAAVQSPPGWPWQPARRRGVRHAGQAECHFHTAQRAHQHQFIEVAQVADPEHLVRDPSQALAKRQVEAAQRDLSQAVGPTTVGHHHRRQRGTVLLGVGAEYFQTPTAHCRPRRLGQAKVAGEHVGQALLLQHGDRFVQSVEQVGGRRGRKEPVGIGRQHVFPVPVGPGQPGGARGGDGLVAEGIEGQARRQHQALLRAAHADVHAPLVVAIVHRGERRDRVHHQQCRVSGAIHCLPDLRHPAGDAGGRLVVHDAHRLVAVRPIGSELFLDCSRIGAAAPVTGKEVHLQSEALRHPLPERGEMAGLAHQHRVASDSVLTSAASHAPVPDAG